MIDPTDDVLDIYRYGDADVMPTATGGVNGAPAVTDYEASRKRVPYVFRSQIITLTAFGTAGANAAMSIGDRPEYWAITGLTSPNTNTEAWIWAASAPAGYPAAILSGTGNAKISGVGGAGNGYHLWIENRGSAAMRLLVRAVSGFDYCDNSY